MDASTTNAVAVIVTALFTLLGKGGWDFLKSRRAASAVVQTAQIADEATMRSELWNAMTKMQERMDGLQSDLAASRKEHIELLGEHALLKAEHAALKREHEALLVRYAAIESRVNAA